MHWIQLIQTQTALLGINIHKTKTAADGGITLFLSLILLLMLELAAVFLESARINTSFTIADRAFINAMDSVLTEYYLPLYEDYHLFFMEKGIDSDELEKEELYRTMEEYMIKTFEPGKALTFMEQEITLSNMDLYGLKIKSGKIEKLTRATDFRGTIFSSEAEEYMKYRVPADLAEQFLGASKEIKSAQKASQAVEKKLEAEEAAGELNQDVLELMELIEGISTGRNGIRFTKKGSLKTENYFVKKFCTLTPDMETTAISHSLVWESLKERYINPVTVLNEIKEDLMQINQLEEEKEQDKDRNDNSEDQLQSARKNIQANHKLLKNTARQIIKKTERVLLMLPLLREKQLKAAEKLNDFEKCLNENRGELKEDVLAGMQDDLKAMESYIQTEQSNDREASVISRVLKMEPVLKSNKNILNDLTGSGLEDIMSIDLLIEEFQSYTIKPFSFDYSGLVCEPDTKSPMDSIKDLWNSSILDLVTAEDVILSEKKINDPDRLYSSQKTNTADDKTEAPDYSKMLKNSDKDGYNSEITQSFGHVEKLGAVAEGGLRDLILYEYADSHFRNIVSGDEKEKETALEYEKEYLIGGNAGDVENLSGTVNKIIFIRTVTNFISILSDGEKGKLAYATAAALVGFTGLEPLIRLTKTLILIVWSFEEALVDMAVLLSGGNIPLLKDGKGFSMGYEDLLLVNKKMIQDKANNKKSLQGGIADLTYQDYIRLFFLMEGREKVCYRMMDLIENNIRLRYHNDFSMERCTYGIQAEGLFTIPKKFLTLSFSPADWRDLGQGWAHTVRQEYTY